MGYGAFGRRGKSLKNLAKWAYPGCDQRQQVQHVQQRGRKSAASVALAPFRPVAGPPIEPPADLEPAARVIFVETVAAAPAGEYQPVDIDLLAAYARAVLQERAASAAIAADMEGASPALLKAQRQAQHAMVILSRRLRIGPLGRQPNRSVRANTRPATQLSYYDVMALERRNDGQAERD